MYVRFLFFTLFFLLCVCFLLIVWNDTYLTIIVSTPEYHVGRFEEFVQRWMQAI